MISVKCVNGGVSMVQKIIGVVFLVPGVIMVLVGLTEKNNAEIWAGIIFALPGL